MYRYIKSTDIGEFDALECIREFLEDTLNNSTTEYLDVTVKVIEPDIKDPIHQTGTAKFLISGKVRNAWIEFTDSVVSLKTINYAKLQANKDKFGCHVLAKQLYLRAKEVIFLDNSNKYIYDGEFDYYVNGKQFRKSLNDILEKNPAIIRAYNEHLALKEIRRMIKEFRPRYSVGKLDESKVIPYNHSESTADSDVVKNQCSNNQQSLPI